LTDHGTIADFKRLTPNGGQVSIGGFGAQVKDWLAEVQFRGSVVEHHNLVKIVSTRTDLFEFMPNKTLDVTIYGTSTRNTCRCVWLDMQGTKQIKLNMAWHATVQGAK
jgi:hypothetical protein